MSKKLILVFILIFSLIVLGACSPNETPAGDEEPEQAEDVNVAEVITEQWQDSAHATAVHADNPEDTPAMSEGGNCFSCHNGYAFEIKAENLDKIGILKGASCDTCHTGQGKELIEKGTVTVPLGDIEGGKGSLCISCHSGRGKEPNQESAPHSSVQADMLLSRSGAEIEDFDYGSSPHANSTDTCLSCHMAEENNGIRDHRFKINEENIDNSCGKCHNNLDTINREAQGDYDGDGNKEGIQDEVAGLLEILNNEILEKLDGGKFVSTHGQIEFQDKDGNAMESPPSPELYNAAWNYFFVDSDGSRGIHNPVYAVQLLQQSYRALTDEDVPDADIRE